MTIEHKIWQENAFGIKEIYISDAKVEVPFL